MKTIYFLILSIVLTACTTDMSLVKPESNIAKQYEYVIKLPPSELLTIPEPVAPINVDTAKQSDIAKWILSNEERSRILENTIKSIADFFKTEQSKLDALATEKNKNSINSTADTNAQSAIDATNKAVTK